MTSYKDMADRLAIQVAALEDILRQQQKDGLDAIDNLTKHYRSVMDSLHTQIDDLKNELMAMKKHPRKCMSTSSQLGLVAMHTTSADLG